MVSEARFTVIPGLPLFAAADDVGEAICVALDNAGMAVSDGDILVVAQKIVSKAEGRLVRLDAVTPGDAAVTLARETEKDPRLVQLILNESTEVVRKKPGVIIVRHRLGHVGANAGIDQSNVEHADGECALLLPLDPDASAQRIRATVDNRFGVQVAVIIADSMNRPWRLGTIACALGVAGLQVIDDLRGGHDMFGRELKVAMVNRADSLAAAAGLLMGETTERTPVVLIKGFPVDSSDDRAAVIVRPPEDDMFK